MTEEQISQRAIEIGDRPAFPMSRGQIEGMTYRMWLYGKAVACTDSGAGTIWWALQALAAHELSEEDKMTRA